MQPPLSALPTRTPRGTRLVVSGFFAALDQAPQAQRAAIAQAAQNMIRDELKLRRDRARAAATKLRARKHGAPKAKPARQS